MSKQTLRGNEIYIDKNGNYRYSDNKTYTVENWEAKPCGFCGLGFTEQGHDGCIGTLANVMNACCGHGITKDAYVQFNNKKRIEGQEALNYIQKNKAIDQAV